MSQPSITRARSTASGRLDSISILAASAGRRSIVAGRILQGFLLLFLLFDGAARLVGFAPYVEGTVKYGYPESFAPGIALTLLLSTALYAVPRTALLGAILLTGYLGGAVASHLRVGEPFLFPLFFGAFVWLALYLRDPTLRSLVLRRRAD